MGSIPFLKQLQEYKKVNFQQRRVQGSTGLPTENSTGQTQSDATHLL